MFAGELFVVEQAWPRCRSFCTPSVTGGGDKIGFRHDATPDVFIGRQGDGPLILCPDTNVLIWMVNEIEYLEEKIGLITAPLLGGSWDDPVEAIGDLLHIWQFRDIRFFVSDHYLTDGNLTPERRKIRERVVRELSLDFIMRGGFETVVDDLEAEDDDPRLLSRGCMLHPLAQRTYMPTSPISRWPHAKDRPLLADAFASGCHAFVTCDKGVLACAPEFARWGLAIMTPGELLERLDRDNQLDAVPEWPIDLDVITRFYGIAVAVEAAA